MNREIRTITHRESWAISQTQDGYIKETIYETIEEILTSADTEDGGGHYDLILQDKKTKQFFIYSFCDWDVDNSDYNEDNFEEDKGMFKTDFKGRFDLPLTISEVFQKQIIKTIYE